MQEKMDERELLGKHGAGVHQVPHQRVPAQTGGWAGPGVGAELAVGLSHLQWVGVGGVAGHSFRLPGR